MKIIVLQHLDVEHPGIFRDFMRADGLTWDTVEVDAGEPIPDLRKYDLMLVMGGPQDVWQEDEFPWLREEKRAIRSFVSELKRPYLGICLGHQLLADALGGKVGLADQPEVGILPITKTDEGRRDGLLSKIPDTTTVLQWHGAEVIAPPEDSAVLASSDQCAVQALRCGDCAYGIQFHVELTDRTVADWAAIPAYAEALEKVLGAGAASSLKEQSDAHMAQFNSDARHIYDGFMSKVRETAKG